MRDPSKPLRCRHHVCLTVTAALLTVSTAGVSQSPAPTWQRVLSGPGYGALFDAVPTDDHHIVAVGATNHRHTPPYSGDALLVQVTAVDGRLGWERTWGGDGYEQAWAVARAPDGGFFVFGETDSYGAGNRDFFLLKIDANGAEIWFRTYGTPAREWPFGMLALANGDLLLYGLVKSEDDRGDPYAVRVNSEGRVAWEYTARSDTDAFFLDALETEAGQIVLCASVAEDGALVALGPDGDSLWTQRYELAGWQYPSAIATTDDGYLLTGFAMIETGPNRQADVWLAKTSRDGTLEWQRSFGAVESDDYGMELLRVADDGYVIGGFGQGMPLWKIDATGDLIWERRLDDVSLYATGAVHQLDDGGFLVSGLKVIRNGQSNDAVLLRTDAAGQTNR